MIKGSGSLIDNSSAIPDTLADEGVPATPETALGLPVRLQE